MADLDLPDFSQYLTGGVSDSTTQQLLDAATNEAGLGERRRGRSVEPNEEEKAAVAEFAGRLQTKDAPFDLLDKPRVLLHSGEVQKKGTEAFVKRTNKRHLALFNDCLVVAAVTKDAMQLKQVLPLDSAKIEDLRWDSANVGANCLGVLTEDRPYHFLCASADVLEEWLRELGLAVKACCSAEERANFGWQHDVCRGTPWSAALVGSQPALEYHLSQPGADPDERDGSGLAPAHYAAAKNQVDCLQLLLSNGADVNALGDSLDTPLHLAAGHAAEHCVNVLLAAGADVGLCNMDDHSPFHLAIRGCERSASGLRILSALKIQGSDIDDIDGNGETPLHTCAKERLSRMAAVLTGLGAEPNPRRTADGRTPLHVAASDEEPDPEVLRALLRGGSRPNLVDERGLNTIAILLDPRHEQSVREAARRRASTTGESEAPAGGLSEEYVMRVLQPLLEVTRCGARLDEQTAAKLPPMAAEMLEAAAQQWREKTAPARLLEFIPRMQPKVAQSRWMGDTDAPCCQLCPNTFTMVVRRHHCRNCGTLCCNECSMKRVPLFPEGPVGNKPAELQRVCDACFNEVLGRYDRATEGAADVLRARKQIEERQRKKREEAEKEKAQRRELIGKDAEEKSDSEEERSAMGSQVGEVQSTMARNMQMLQERGQKLETLGNKAEGMASAAQEFASLAKELRKKQESRRGTWGVW